MKCKRVQDKGNGLGQTGARLQSTEGHSVSPDHWVPTHHLAAHKPSPTQDNPRFTASAATRWSYTERHLVWTEVIQVMKVTRPIKKYRPNHIFPDMSKMVGAPFRFGASPQMGQPAY